MQLHDSIAPAASHPHSMQAAAGATAAAAAAVLALALLCCAAPLAAAAGSPVRRVEFYGFATAHTPTYKHYDWSVLTAAAWRTDAPLVEAAEAAGARVELNAGDVREAMSSEARRKAWVSAKVVEALKLGARGINFDLEEPLQAGSKGASDYTALVKLAAQQLHEALPGATVSVDVPWSPHDVDGRNYDWLGLAAAADMLFVMVYDTASQIFGRCIAGANSPLDLVRRGLQQWLALGVPASKLVLGLPWYGYDYACQASARDASPPADDVDVCVLRPVSFRGASCSDAVGAQKCYWEVMQMLRQGLNTTEVHWDGTQAAPYFNYRTDDGSIHQVWFDDPASLTVKWGVAAELGLRGIGVWNLDCLDYGSKDARVQQQTAEMWAAVRAVVGAFGGAAAAQTGQQQPPHKQ